MTEPSAISLAAIRKELDSLAKPVIQGPTAVWELGARRNRAIDLASQLAGEVERLHREVHRLRETELRYCDLVVDIQDQISRLLRDEEARAEAGCG